MLHAKRLGLLGAVGLAIAASGAGADDPGGNADGDLIVLTALPVTYSIATALAAGTHVTVQNVPDNGRRMNSQQNYFTLQAPKLAEQFSHAAAVVTIGKLWQDDPLFVAVRATNIRVVDIDATKPYSDTLEGVSVAFEPRTDAPWSKNADEGTPTPSVYFWLSASNVARAADIVGQDLMRLAPADGNEHRSGLAAYAGEALRQDGRGQAGGALGHEHQGEGRTDHHDLRGGGERGRGRTRPRRPGGSGAATTCDGAGESRVPFAPVRGAELRVRQRDAFQRA